MQQLVKDGLVKINGTVPKRSYTLAGGETVSIDWPEPDDPWPFPQDIPLDIVFEDDEFIIVNKQQGLIVHPSPGHPDGTMVNALLHKFPNLPGINGVKRPGIVHRLDRDTTGLLVVAKTEKAMNVLAKNLQKRTMHRRYVALLIGRTPWEKLTVDAAIGRDPQNRLRRAIDGPSPRDARSHFRVLLRSHKFTLIECKLETGRTHQIRIHAKHVGYPIVCDDTYGGHVKRCLERLTSDEHELRRALQLFNRPFLHAYDLSFPHPTTGKTAHFQVPLPENAQQLLSIAFGESAEKLKIKRIAEIES